MYSLSISHWETSIHFTLPRSDCLPRLYRMYTLSISHWETSLNFTLPGSDSVSTWLYIQNVPLVYHPLGIINILYLTWIRQCLWLYRMYPSSIIHWETLTYFDLPGSASVSPWLYSMYPLSTSHWETSIHFFFPFLGHPCRSSWLYSIYKLQKKSIIPFTFLITGVFIPDCIPNLSYQWSDWFNPLFFVNKKWDLT